MSLSKNEMVVGLRKGSATLIEQPLGKAEGNISDPVFRVANGIT